MSNQNFSAIGALQATVGIGQYIVNDYVLTLEPLETGDGYTLTIRKGSDVQTVTLEGLSEENLEIFRGYVAAAQAAQLAAEGAQTAAETAQGNAEDAQDAAEAAQSLAETAQAAAETAETNAGASATQAGTSASSAAQSATQAAGSAAAAAQTLTDVQAAGQAQIAAIGAEGERVLETIPEDYTELSGDVSDLKTSLNDVYETVYGNDIPSDIFGSIGSFTAGTSGGITYSKNANVISASGTRSGYSARTLLNSRNSLPEGFVPGKKYRINVTSSNQYLKAVIVFIKDGSDLNSIATTETQEFTIPSDANGIEISIRVYSGWPSNGSGTITYPQIFRIGGDGGLVGDVESLQEDISNINEDLYGDNPVEILQAMSTYSNGSSAGITYTLDTSTGIVTASGTRSGNSFKNVLSSPSAMPEGIVPGKSYNFMVSSSSEYLKLYIIYSLNGSEAGVVDFTENTKVTIPEWATGIQIRFQVFSGWPSNSSATITFPKMYTIPENKGISGEVEELGEIDKETFSRARFINKELTKLEEIRNCVDKSVSALMTVESNEGATKTISLSGLPSAKKMYQRLSLHYGSSSGTPTQEDVFFGGDCKTDFSDVRFFDSNGKMLRAYFSPAVDMDLIQDSKLDNVVQVTPSGNLIAFSEADDNGIWISTDNGANFTKIPGTEDVTEHASEAYHLTSLCPVYVDDDDNIFAYAGGKLYKMLASDNYATKTEVLDFSWDDNGTTIYPDIQPQHSFDKSTNGTLFVGACYQPQYHVSIYKSTDGGSTWSLSWHSWEGTTYQHVHHIHADPYSDRVYVGIDDNGGTWSGSRILYTDDEGVTWTEVDPDTRTIRGKDFFPIYFGDGTYMLGGGETYLMGSGTIYRSKDCINFDIPVLGLSGQRDAINDFGNDSLILSGSCACTLSAENHLFMSTDKGKTWESIFTKYLDYFKSAGSGFRKLFPYIELNGDSEPCMILSGSFHGGTVHAQRIYKGGSHFFREVFVELEDTSGSATITAKSGYMMPYPYEMLQEQDNSHLLYSIPLNEGCGSYVEDSRNQIAQINGVRAWDDKKSVRYGEYQGETTKFDYTPSSGLKIGNDGKLAFPANEELNFSNGYSVSMWVNPAMIGLEIPNDEHYSDTMFMFRHLVTIGDSSFVMRGRSQFGIIRSFANPTNSNYYNNRFAWNGKQFSENTGILMSDQYFHVMFTVSTNGTVNVYVNGCPASSDWGNDASNALGNLSQGNIKFNTTWPGGNVGYISDVRVYDTEYSNTDVMMLYRGWKPAE